MCRCTREHILSRARRNATLGVRAHARAKHICSVIICGTAVTSRNIALQWPEQSTAPPAVSECSRFLCVCLRVCVWESERARETHEHFNRLTIDNMFGRRCDDSIPQLTCVAARRPCLPASTVGPVDCRAFGRSVHGAHTLNSYFNGGQIAHARQTYVRTST